MKAMTRILTLIVAVAMVAPAMADWNEGDPYKMHWAQLPDLDNGMNVLATDPNILYDNFLCTETGPITDIHIWGSWLNDWLPAGPGTKLSPSNVRFRLSIHRNFFGGHYAYNMPGELLWEADRMPSEWQYWAQSDEDFYNPSSDEIIGTDRHVIQYNFFDFEEPFVQERDTIYWLGVTAFPFTGAPGPDAVFGWKTSKDNWNDAESLGACFWPQYEPGFPPGLRLTLKHPDTGEYLDLAFVITPEPATLALLGLGAIGLAARRRRKH